MFSSERLTYLLSLATAAISWGVVEISSDANQSKIVSYEISHHDVHGRRESTLLLVNSSIKENPGNVTVEFVTADSGQNCDFRFKQDGLGISPLGKVEPEVTSSGARAELESMYPGSMYKFEVSYNINCTLIHQVLFSDKSTRIVSRGAETFVLEKRFNILIILVVIFVIVFGIAFFISVVSKNIDEGVLLKKNIAKNMSEHTNPESVK